MEKTIKKNLEDMLKTMGIDFNTVQVNKESEKAYYADIDTDNSSLLIGWHGETIGAIQHILKCLLWNKDIPSEVQIIVDVDSYKRRQEESVLRLAERKAELAINSQKEILLPPMNPYFRRKIHLFLADDERYKNSITTESIGHGTQRQIRIIPK